MARLEFGVSFLRQLWTTDIPGLARRAEEAEFDYLACGEHVIFHGPIPNAFIALAVAAGVTQRIKLLSAATLLPLYPAVLVAKITAMLDVASGGRFNLGVGIGGEIPAEFEACGVPLAERGRRSDEALVVISRLLSEQNVSFSGRFNRFSDVSLQPAPLQKPRPPIWVAGRKEAAMRRAARYGDGWLPYLYTPDQLRQSIETIGQYVKGYGRKLNDIRAGIYTFITVYADSAKAKRVAAELVGENYQQDFSKLVDRYLVAGTPEQCRQRLREYSQAGAQMVLMCLACPPEDIDATLRLAATEIMPEFR